MALCPSFGFNLAEFPASFWVISVKNGRNGDFGGFQVRQFTEGQYELATGVPGFADTANAELVAATAARL